MLFLEHKRTYRLIQGEVPEERRRVPIGEAEIARAGADLTVDHLRPACYTNRLEAAEALAGEGIECTVVDLRTLLPARRGDRSSSRQKRRARCLVVHEDNLTGGVGAEVAALIAEQAFEYLDAPIRRLGGPDVPAMPYQPRHGELLHGRREKEIRGRGDATWRPTRCLQLFGYGRSPPRTRNGWGHSCGNAGGPTRS